MFTFCSPRCLAKPLLECSRSVHVLFLIRSIVLVLFTFCSHRREWGRAGGTPGLVFRYGVSPQFRSQYERIFHGSNNLADFCPVCGKDKGIVGRAHLCVPLDGQALVPVANQPANAQRLAKPANSVANSASTYRHRDADKRREYMRQYMAKKRGKMDATQQQDNTNQTEGDA